MEQVTAYKSADGKVFETAEECRKHEENLFPMFNSFGEPCDNTSRASFVYIDNIELKEIFLKRYCLCPEAVPDKPGLWYYDSEKLKWVKIKDYVDSIVETWNKILRQIGKHKAKEKI